MLARIALGVLLALLSWCILLGILLALGRWAAVIASGSRRGDVVVRAGLWWGAAIAVLLVAAASLLAPLGGVPAGVTLLAATAVLGAVGWTLRRPRWPRIQRPSASVTALLAALVAAVVYLALKVLGPVTNYDTGLYHLGAIKYAADYGTVPGLATLFFPFGYANVQFPLAAILGNGPWDGVGYRLLNGLLVLAVVTDVAVRLLSGRRGWGTFVLAIGISAWLVPLVALGDYVVTSPTADTAVMLLSLVSGAYLADAVSRRRAAALEISVVVVTAGLTVAMRPTMLAYAGVVVLVLAVVALRRRRTWIGRPTATLLTLSWVALLGAVLIARDRVLSGWLLYPLSVLPFDTSWRAADPTPWRDATLAAARDPFAPDQYVVAHSWGWIGAWLRRLPQQWEFWFLLVGVAVTVGVLLLAHRRAGFPRRPRLLLLALAPSLAAVLAWFVASPPSFRFIWGPLLLVVLLPLGAAVSDLTRHAEHSSGTRRPAAIVLAACAVAVASTTAFSLATRSQVDQITQVRDWRLGPLSVPYAIAPVPAPPVVPVEMRTGLVLFSPEAGSDQCWDNYPLCSFSMGDDIALRGETIADGFVRR